ncbi:MAG TPA: hypothetical protein VN851_14930 [Thermoanaerobaculia bacterium]|nr:hypothetical protein [Thermoanaerobaculia bacterium]
MAIENSKMAGPQEQPDRSDDDISASFEPSSERQIVGKNEPRKREIARNRGDFEIGCLET